MPYTAPHFFLFDIEIDPCDQHLLAYKWHQNKAGFYTRLVKQNGTSKVLSLHREILGLTKNTLLIVEFINNDKNDLRRSNLRVLTSSQAQLKKVNAKGYTQLKNQKYMAQISIHNHKKYLGCFDSVEEAKQAYNLEKEKYMKQIDLSPSH